MTFVEVSGKSPAALNMDSKYLKGYSEGYEEGFRDGKQSGLEQGYRLSESIRRKIMTLGKMYVIVNEENGQPAMINGKIIEDTDKQKLENVVTALNQLRHEAHDELIMIPKHLVIGA